MKITSQPLVFLDTTDSRKLEVYISSNHPTVQLYDVNDKDYTPDWSKTNLKLSADIFLDSEEIVPQKKKWYRQFINETSETLVSTGDFTDEITVSTNMTSAIVTYICRVEYQGLTAVSKITFTKTDTGLNGSNGKDGTSVRILGTATAVSKVVDTDYYTITYSSSAITAAELGDAYLYNGNLYVCAVKRDADDYFINVGNIQGPAGKDGVSAKLITLSSSSQVFKVSSTGTVTPATIAVTATAINTSVSSWTYSTDGGKTFSSTVPTGLSRNGNSITITGSTLTANSVVIQASDGTYGDTLTVHKVVDGSKGDSASMAFLTNENISFAANSVGQISLTSLTTNVVAYRGAEKVMPTVGTPSGAPSGMTISVDSTSLANSSKEVMLTISIANNSTLGSTSSNHGTITIPITSPVSTNLSLSWSKINAGQTGTSASLVNISPSALYFKSTTGANGTFTPQYIYLYPTFQNATYSSWQYSTDGGATWTSASGANGLTIGTYNSIANSLRVDRASTLYTSSVTSISFRCNSTNASVYDVVSIAKIYDIVDLQIGGRNILKNTDKMILVTKDSAVATGSAFSAVSGYDFSELVGKKLTFSYFVSCLGERVNNGGGGDLDGRFGMHGSITWKNSSDGKTTITYPFDSYLYTTNIDRRVSMQTTATPPNGYDTIQSISVACQPLAKPASSNSATWKIGRPKLEIGNTATDWSPAPEDLLNEAANVNVMLSNESHFFEATASGIPTAKSIVLDVVGYKGSVQSNTTVGTISGLPASGMTATIASNGTTSTKITIAVTEALTSADSGVLTIPVTVNGYTINKKFSWVKARAGDPGTSGVDAVTFQVYSTNGYALSINTPAILLQTFAYVGDAAIQTGATYQWYSYASTGWTAISGATNSYYTVSRDIVSFSNSYMCKMQFNGAEYVGVVTIDDKSDENKVFTTKPSNYTAGDLWIVGADYRPSNVEIGTLLKAQYTNKTYADADWIKATRYDDQLKDLQDNLTQYNQYFSFDSTQGVKITAKDSNGVESKYSTTISNDEWAINYGSEAVTYVDETKMHIKEAEIESPLSVTGKYSGSTMLQAPIINIGNFSLVVESNGSLSVVVKS